MLIRPLGPDDAAAFRALRVRALREHPEAFGRTPEEVYASCGFTSVAVKPRALKVGDRYYDEELMALALKPS
jgi:hypothetical protein